MKRYLQSRNLWVVAALWGGFWLIAPLIERHFLIDFVNSLAITGCVGVFVMYVGSVARAFHRNDLGGAHYLVVGICGFMISQACRYAWNWSWRYLGKPDGMQDHIFVAWLIWVAFTCACVHLAARGVIAGEIPKENFRWIGVVTGIAVFIGFITVAFIEP